jgi:DNA-binding beta-propeller fold protein YncE
MSQASGPDPEEPAKVGPTQNVEQSIEALFGPEEKKDDLKAGSEEAVQNDEPILYISDTDNGRIIVMQGISGDGYSSIGLPGYGYGRFLRPAQVWVDFEKRLYIADSGNDRIVRVDQRAENGWQELDGLSGPTGVAVDKSGIYIADTGANRIVKVDDIKKDAPITETITHPQLSRPTTLWIDSTGALYACCGEDPPGGKVFKTWMDKDRRRWKIFEGEGLTGSRFRPSGIVTTGSALKMLDGSGQRVVNMQDMDGRQMKEQRFRETKQRRLSRPQGLAVDPSGQKFYIADSGNDRVLEVKADGTVVGEFFQFEGEPTSGLRNPTSVFVFTPAPVPDEEDKDEKDKDKKKKK